MKYNWQLLDWPDFKYRLDDLEDKLYAFGQYTGHLQGALKAMQEDLQVETLTNTMVAEALKTSEIEGEYLSRKDVMSSIKNNLKLGSEIKQVRDKKAKGAAELMIDVRSSFKQKLSQKKLFEWHKILFQYRPKIKIGNWRTGTEPMQVVSGRIGKEKIHFEAPPSVIVPQEMRTFVSWFNDSAPKGKKEIKQAPVRSAITHLYFESIHPFEDGNGRIGRAIAEKALYQSVGRPVLLSLSETIESQKTAYYKALQEAQTSNEITSWIIYFINVILTSMKRAESLIDFTIQKARFFDCFRDKLNKRQLKVVKRMLEEGPDGFEGGMSAKKYMSIAKTSKPTATRDLQSLAELNVFKVKGAGRSTRYFLNF